jgi:hypothetical protein
MDAPSNVLDVLQIAEMLRMQWQVLSHRCEPSPHQPVEHFVILLFGVAHTSLLYM